MTAYIKKDKKLSIERCIPCATKGTAFVKGNKDKEFNKKNINRGRARGRP